MGPRSAHAWLAVILAIGAVVAINLVLVRALRPDGAPAHGDGRAAREPYSYRVEDSGILFVLADGTVVVDALDGLTPDEEVDTHAASDGRLLAVTTDADRTEGRLYLFDRATGRRAPGWEEPLTLAACAPESWQPLDPYDATSPATRLFQPRFMDIEDDGVVELVANVQGLRWGTGGLVRISLDRRVRGCFLQFGHVRLLEVADINEDGWQDFLCKAEGNRFRFRDMARDINPKLAFAIDGRTLADDERRCEGPPGRPDHPTVFDAGALRFAYLAPCIRVDGRALCTTVRALHWEPDRKEVTLHLGLAEEPLQQVNAFFRVGPTGALARTADGQLEPGVVPFPVRLEEAGVEAFPHPIPLVVDGARLEPEGWELVVDPDANGVSVYRMLEE